MPFIPNLFGFRPPLHKIHMVMIVVQVIHHLRQRPHAIDPPLAQFLPRRRGEQLVLELDL